jgi:Mn-dependent DtxR family transcriptional regulator
MNDLLDGKPIAVTQEMFSDMLGVQRTSVTLAAASLQNFGAIRYRRGHISCECYGAVRRTYDHVRA